MTIAQQFFYVCLISGLILFGAELFLPGGVVGALGCLALIGAIIAGFQAYPGYGAYIAIGIVFLSAAAFMMWMVIFPRTRLGARLSLGSNLKNAKSSESGLAALLHQVGVTTSELRPAGYAQIDGRRVDVVTRGEMIGRGEGIVVIEIEGNRVLVAAQQSPAESI
ncbi:MAG: hypothetical protein O3A51_11930 [Verrucomicrobia bacterium]|nr:hypothetical protein [Verrucomicrobiota bacterium]